LPQRGAAPPGTWHAFSPWRFFLPRLINLTGSHQPQPLPIAFSFYPFLGSGIFFFPVAVPITALCRLAPPGPSSLLQQDQQVQPEVRLDPRRYWSSILYRLVLHHLAVPSRIPRAVCCKDCLLRLAGTYLGSRAPRSIV
ncbi:hypothetical protein BAE44_0021815, partial [Dichanthelium oligosanthes]